MAFLDLILNGGILSEIRATLNKLIEKDNARGWIDAVDTEYTEQSPLSVPANTPTLMTINELANRDDQGPQNIDLFANDRVTGRYGDLIGVKLRFKVKKVGNAATFINFKFDIGSGLNEIIVEDRNVTLRKGAGVENPVHASFIAYTYDTWEANGARIILESDGEVEVYGMSMVLANLIPGRAEQVV